MSRGFPQFVILVLACSLGGTVTGCASTRHFQAYAGPERKGFQAIIKSDSLKPNEYFRILTIDGQELAMGGKALLAGQVVSAGLLPGAHTIECEIRVGTSGVTPRLLFTAVEGETYLVKFEARGYGVRVWIANARTGLEPGGVVRRGDEPY